MTNTFRTLHPMACRCRDCRAPRMAADLAPRPRWRLHPLAKVFIGCCAFWVAVAVALVTSATFTRWLGGAF